MPRQSRVGPTSNPNSTTLHGTGQASQGAKDGTNHDNSVSQSAISTTRVNPKDGTYDSDKSTTGANKVQQVTTDVTNSMTAYVNQRNQQTVLVNLTENAWWADEVNV